MKKMITRILLNDEQDGKKKVKDIVYGENEEPVIIIGENGYGHETTLPQQNLSKITIC